MNTTPLLIGDRPLSLAAHLRHVSSLLSTKAVGYDWKLYNACNCGLLARSILGLTSGELLAQLEEIERGVPHAEGSLPTWTSMSKTYCPLNPDIPAASIFKTLRNAGLSQTDFNHVEYLSHPELSKVGSAKERFTDVAAYMTRWAEVIEAFHAAKTSAADAVLEAIESRPLVNA